VRDAADFLASCRVEDRQRAAIGSVLPLAVDEELGIGIGHDDSGLRDGKEVQTAILEERISA